MQCAIGCFISRSLQEYPTIAIGFAICTGVPLASCQAERHFNKHCPLLNVISRSPTIPCYFPPGDPTTVPIASSSAPFAVRRVASDGWTIKSHMCGLTFVGPGKIRVDASAVRLSSFLCVLTHRLSHVPAESALRLAQLAIPRACLFFVGLLPVSKFPPRRAFRFNICSSAYIEAWQQAVPLFKIFTYVCCQAAANNLLPVVVPGRALPE